MHCSCVQIAWLLKHAGDVERDFWLAFDLLRAPKDHAEFTLVRDWIRRQLGSVCSAVSMDRPKSVLKQVICSSMCAEGCKS